MLLLSGALVSGPYALITTAVSADLVSGHAAQRKAGGGARVGASAVVVIVTSIRDNDGLY